MADFMSVLSGRNKQNTYFERSQNSSSIEISIENQKFSLIRCIVCKNAEVLSLAELQKAEASLSKTLNKTNHKDVVPMYASLLAELQECIKKRGEIVK